MSLWVMQAGYSILVFPKPIKCWYKWWNLNMIFWMCLCTQQGFRHYPIHTNVDHADKKTNQPPPPPPLPFLPTIHPPSMLWPWIKPRSFRLKIQSSNHPAMRPPLGKSGANCNFYLFFFSFSLLGFCRFIMLKRFFCTCDHFCPMLKVVMFHL